jgi:oligopeptide transport system permease protein
MNISRHKPRGTIRICLALLGFLLLIAFLGPYFSPYDGTVLTDSQFARPGAEHWFGTDINGFDVFTRTLEGARISFLVGLLGAGISLIIGTIYGLVAGLAGGKLDNLMMRFVDFLFSLPRVILIILIIAAFDDRVKVWMDSLDWHVMYSYSRIGLIFITLGCIEWLTIARIVRGQVLVLKEMPYVCAARSQGASFWRLVFKHLFPNIRGVVIVYTTLAIPAVILTESFLSYLGLGIQAPYSSLGTLLSDGSKMINPVEIYWWLLVGPAIFLALTLLALNFLGDALRDYFDPKSK